MPLLTYEEYRKANHPGAHIFELKLKNNSLFYFGERHSFDPKDPQWNEVKDLWQKFASDASAKKIVFVEGGVRDMFPTEIESITSDGGMGLVTFLASQSKIETFSPEPEDAFERSEMEKAFSRDEIQYYYFARMVYQWAQKQEPKPNFEAYMQRSLESDKRKSGWVNYDFSIAHMKSVHQDIFKTEFSLTDPEFFYEIINPAKASGRTVINNVSTKSSQVRDAYIADTIISYMKNGFSIFVQFGQAHAIIQEPYLREKLL